jgi:hypothetical protein
MDQNTRDTLTRICLEIQELLGKEEQQEEKVKKFGTLRILGAAVPAPEEPFHRGDILGYNGKDFEIGDTVAGKELTWLRLGDIWVCDRNILQGVSWDTLNEKGFVYGKEVEIDGEKYKLRILTGSSGSEYGEGCDNEWDQLMDAYKEDNNLLHYDNMYSWCQEENCDYSSSRSVRGYGSARYCDNYGATIPNSYFGWRPALEKLETDN